jgi:hypothetical protein
MKHALKNLLCINELFILIISDLLFMKQTFQTGYGKQIMKVAEEGWNLKYSFDCEIIHGKCAKNVPLFLIMQIIVQGLAFVMNEVGM